MKVICDKKETCKHAFMCGGSKPHIYDDNECNKCPMNKNAKCIVIEE